MESKQASASNSSLSNSTDRPTGTKRADLGQLTETREVSIVVGGADAYPTMGTRTARMDETGQEWVKFSGTYWKYPQQVDR